MRNSNLHTINFRKGSKSFDRHLEQQASLSCVERSTWTFVRVYNGWKRMNKGEGWSRRKWDRGIRTKPDDSRTGRKKTILCISRPRFHSDTGQTFRFRSHRLVQEDWIALKPGTLELNGRRPGPSWRDEELTGEVCVYIYIYITVYRITYLVLDCHRGPFPVIPAGLTLRKTKPDKLLTIHPPRITLLVFAAWIQNAGTVEFHRAETGRVSLTPLNILLSLSYRHQSRAVEMGSSIS